LFLFVTVANVLNPNENKHLNSDQKQTSYPDKNKPGDKADGHLLPEHFGVGM
jgi:hypothetical protein